MNFYILALNIFTNCFFNVFTILSDWSAFSFSPWKYTFWQMRLPEI